MIPKRLVRTAPEATTIGNEILWDRATLCHPTWDLIVWRSQVHPALFPISSDLWPQCNRQQILHLVAIEDLFTRGGVWLAEGFEVEGPLDILLGLPAFTIGDEVLGFEPGHMGLALYLETLQLAIERNDDTTGLFDSCMKFRGDILRLAPDAIKVA